MNDPPRISVAIPILNERQIIPQLLSRTFAVLDAQPGGPHEVVIVDDGSRDGSGELLEAACRDEPRLTVIRLSRNFGHQAVLGAALDYVQGDVVVLMDGDLQDAPEYIPEFVAEYLLGHDVVYAQRIKRKEPLWLRLCYRLFYGCIARLAQIELPRQAGDFGLMLRLRRRRAAAVTRTASLLARTARWVGFRQASVLVERERRFAGRSKYSLCKLIRLALDGIFSFSVVPLRAAAACGALATLVSLAFVAYAVVAKLLFDQAPRGFTALLVAMVFLSGVQLLFLGILGEYLGRIYEQVKQRPHYVIQRIVRHTCRPTTPKPIDSCTSNIGGGAREHYVLSALERHGVRAGGRILDVGCGDGLFFPQLARYGTVEGIEADATLISDAASRQWPGARGSLRRQLSARSPLPVGVDAGRVGALGGSVRRTAARVTVADTGRHAADHGARVPRAVDSARRPEPTLHTLHAPHLRPTGMRSGHARG